MSSEVKIDSKQVYCATCTYWSGNTGFIWPSTVTFLPNTKGRCNNTYYPSETNCYISCSNWKARY